MSKIRFQKYIQTLQIVISECGLCIITLSKGSEFEVSEENLSFFFLLPQNIRYFNKSYGANFFNNYFKSGRIYLVPYIPCEKDVSLFYSQDIKYKHSGHKYMAYCIK